MDRDANYVAVGAFVLLGHRHGHIVRVLVHRPAATSAPIERYEIYFPGTVSGLTAGSPVRYLGVDVGKVVRISLEPQQRRRVQVIADIDSVAPISGRTLATLTLQGVTGLLFIELDEDPNASHPDVLAQGHRYPVIRSAPSDFDVLLSSLPALATHTTELADRFNRVFSDENVSVPSKRLSTMRGSPAKACRPPFAKCRCWWPKCGTRIWKYRELPPTCGESRCTPLPRSNPPSRTYSMFRIICRRPRINWSTSSRTTSPACRVLPIRACPNSSSCCARAGRRRGIFATFRAA
jgi:hypothetical protein